MKEPRTKEELARFLLEPNKTIEEAIAKTDWLIAAMKREEEVKAAKLVYRGLAGVNFILSTVVMITLGTLGLFVLRAIVGP